MRALVLLSVLALAPACAPFGTGSSDTMPTMSHDPDEDAPDNTTVELIAVSAIAVVGGILYLSLR